MEYETRKNKFIACVLSGDIDRRFEEAYNNSPRLAYEYKKCIRSVFGEFGVVWFENDKMFIGGVGSYRIPFLEKFSGGFCSNNAGEINV